MDTIERAKKGALTRWEKEKENGGLPKVTHKGILQIGDIEIPCAVLNDGNRILQDSGIAIALGAPTGSAKQLVKEVLNEGMAPLPVFVASRNLFPFINEELRTGLLSILTYRDGRKNCKGYRAEALPAMCEVWLKARDAGILAENQLNRAKSADVLMRALAKVGIVSLVDEATGYQEARDRDELHKLLSLYLSEERLSWAKMFPNEFYKQIYRLKKWLWVNSNQRTPLVGKITNQIVYERLPEGVLNELRHRNPITTSNNNRNHRHHQFLSEDVGQPDLRTYLTKVITIMQLSSNWEEFEINLNKILPLYNEDLQVS